MNMSLALRFYTHVHSYNSSYGNDAGIKSFQDISVQN